MECILILTQIRLALVFLVIHKDIGSLFGVLSVGNIFLSKRLPISLWITKNYEASLKNNRSIIKIHSIIFYL